MSVKEQLVSGRLVWAKVEPYPWWPGRILKSMQQQDQTVYKIAFFADPTYTYLHDYQIKLFPQFNPPSNGQHQLSPALQRAVKMANAFQNKAPSISAPNEQSQSLELSPFCVLPQKTEEFAEQNSIIPSDRDASSSLLSEVPVDAMIEQTRYDAVTVDNVVKLLQKEETHQKKQGYCYEERKQQIRYQDRLKQALLRRYNLFNFDGKQKNSHSSFSQKPVIQITVGTAIYHPEKKQKKITKTSRKSILHEQIQTISKRCLRKINAILKNSKDNGECTRYNSMQIMRRILLLADNNHLKFKSLFVTLMKTLSACSQGVSCEERLCDFRHYLQRLEGEKGEDEEGSRITQIETSVN